MALQDQTLANTQAKVSLEAAEQRRRRNTEAALAVMRHGASRRPGELPGQFQTMPLTPSVAQSVPEAPGWLRAASDWLGQPGYSRSVVTPGASLIEYAEQVARGEQPGALQTAGAAVDIPVPGATAVKAGLSGLGSLMLGVAGRKAAQRAQRPVVRRRGVHYSRDPNLTEIDPQYAGQGIDALRRAQEARVSSTRPKETFLYTEGSELAGRPEVGLGPHEYRTVDEVEVYDFNADPLGLRQKHRDEWARKYQDRPWMGTMPENEVREAALNDLKDMGYRGYVDQNTGIIGMFEPTAVRRAESGPRAWLENVATVSDIPTEPMPGTRGAPYLRAFERRGGKYVGAPPGVKAPRDIEALVDKYARNIEDALDAGVPEGYFYREGSRAIEEVTESPEAASQLAQAIATTSSEAPVASNVDWAIRGMEQSARGLPIETGLYPNQTRGTLEQVFAGETPELGVKRGRYGAGLYGGEAKGEDVLAPNDRWEARTVGFDVSKGGIGSTQARFIDRVRQEAIRRVNEKRGTTLRPLEGQELNWITERSRGTSAGAMGAPTLDVPTATIQGGLAGRTFQHSWETAPGVAARHAEGMSPAQAETYRTELENVLVDPATGKDVLVSTMGGQLQRPALRGPGVWEGQVTPGVQSRSLVSASSTGLHPSSRGRIEGTEAMRALALGQEAYAGSMMTPGKGGAKDMLATNLGATVAPDTALRVQQALDTEFGPGTTTLVPTEQGFNILKTGDVENFSQRIAKFGDRLNELTGVPGAESVRGQFGPTSIYGELPWGEGRATESVLQTLQRSPGMERRADLPQTRQLMGQVASVYENLKDRGIMPNDKLLGTLKVWEREGLSGVKRLVSQGLAPAALLGVLGAQQLGETRPSGGQTGAPAGGGLPELGV